MIIGNDRDYYEYIVDTFNKSPEKERGDMACVLLGTLPKTPDKIKAYENDIGTSVAKLQEFCIGIIDKYGLNEVPEEEYRKVLASIKRPTN